MPNLPSLNAWLADLPPRWRGGLLLVLVLHLLLGAALGLSVDEAHYALYAAHPALSYFDHPPLVGWVQWPLVILNAPDAVLRFIPGVLWLMTVLLIYQVAGQLQTLAGGSKEQAQRAGLWAMGAALLAPLLHILAIGLVPDTLLMLLHLAVMAHTLRLMASPRPRIGQWLLLGVLLGLAGLSKYTAIFTAAAVVLCLVRAHGWRMAATAGPWLALMVAVIIASPVAIWNAQHQWVSFAYQAQHGAGGAWSAAHLLRFLLVQLLAYGPLVVVGVWGLRALPGPWRWLVAFFFVPFSVLAVLSGGGSSLPHWTAPAWVAWMPFVGLALAQRHKFAAVGSPRTARWVMALLVFQGVCSLALPALMLSGGMPFLAGRSASAESSDPPNPFADLHGWDQAGRTVKRLAAEHGLTSVAVQNWTLASRLGWYARPLPVYVLENRFDQFDIWAGDLPVDARTLLVDWSQMPYETPVGSAAEPAAGGFKACKLLGAESVQHWGYPLAEFRYFDCEAWSGKPQPRLRSMAAPTPSAQGMENRGTP